MVHQSFELVSFIPFFFFFNKLKNPWPVDRRELSSGSVAGLNDQAALGPGQAKLAGG
jgi:hypothetical protein